MPGFRANIHSSPKIIVQDNPKVIQILKQPGL